MPAVPIQTLLDAIPAPVYYKDAAGRYLGCNAAFESLLGCTKERILGRTVFDLAPSALAEIYQRKDEELFLHPGTQVYETALRSADGTILSVIFNKATFLDEAGAVGGLVGVITDITHLRSTEAARIRSESRYRTLTEKMGEGLISTDQDARFTYCNPKFLQMMGYREEEVLGLTFFDLTYDYRFEDFQKRLQDRVQGRSEQYEIQLRHQDGSPVDVLVSAEPLFNALGEFTGTLGIITDIRERKLHEETLRRAHKVESLMMLAGGVAHDFNNLFQTIQGNLEMARELLVDPERARRALERALQSLERANLLSQRMLDYSGKGSSQALPIDLGDLVRMHSTLFSNLTGPGTELKYRIPENLSVIEGDPEQLLQVLNALITNADESLENGSGTITIALEETAENPQSAGAWVEPPPSGKCLILSVADTGRGMAAETLARLFDPFFTTKEPGRGLGMASALGILKGHHVGLQVQSHLGGGTTFRLAFPLRPAGPEPTIPLSTSAIVSLRNGHVLLVDDDPGVRATGAEILKDFLNYQVLTARDGREAVEVFRKHADTISVILMDATMPHMSGSEAYRAIKALHPEAKAILCSGYSDETGHKLMLESGFLAFLKKPYSIKDLQDALEKAIRG